MLAGSRAFGGQAPTTWSSGMLGTAAGLSAVSLAAGPVFYFVHETLWNDYQPSSGEIRVQLQLARRNGDPALHSDALIISRAVAKTIAVRTIATMMDFTINFVVVGDVSTAVGLSAFGFVLGPFVYLGHEKAWDYLSSGRSDFACAAGRLTSSHVIREALALAAGPR